MAPPQSAVLALLVDGEESEDFDEPLELESLEDDFDSLEDDEELSLFLELSFSFISRERFLVP
jgi:hypothetical protein